MAADDKKIATMIWMAIDPRTPEGEAEAALRGLRRLGVSREQLATALGSAHATATKVVYKNKVPDFLDPQMPFGKWAGFKLSHIMREEPSYLCWVLGNLHLNSFYDEQIKMAVMAAEPTWKER